MKHFEIVLAVLLSLFAPQAWAQQCAPAEVQGAAGQPIRTGTAATGWFAWTFCPSDYAVGYWYAYGPWGQVLTTATREIHAARGGMDALRSAVAQRLTGRQCVIERDASGVQAMVDVDAWNSHAALCFALRDEMAAAWPPDPVWAVVPSSTGSRPVYQVVDGVRQTSAVYGVRATNEERCACTAATALPAGSERNRWCPTQGMSATLVTLCGRR